MPTDIEELGRAVKRVQARNHWALDTALGSVGTTLAQWDALRAIGRNPAASAHHLAQETFQSDQAFGTLATRLVRQALIERRPGSGRRIEHYLTEAGQRMLDAGRPIARAVGADTFANLDEEDRATLLALLEKAAGTV